MTYAKVPPAKQAVIGLIVLVIVTMVGDHLDMPFRVANFVFLGMVVAFAYFGARLWVSIVLASISAGALFWEFTPYSPQFANWNSATLVGFMIVSLIGSKLAAQASGHASAPVVVGAAFAGVQGLPVLTTNQIPLGIDVAIPAYGTEQTRMHNERSAPMTDPPVAMPRVAVVIQNGEIEKIVAAESKVDVMVVYLDELAGLSDDEITFEAMEDMLTWHCIRSNPEEIGALQDMVAQTFIERGVTLS